MTAKPSYMDSTPGCLGRRVLACCGLSLLLTASVPAAAVPDPVVVTLGSRYVPGDSDDPTYVVVPRGAGLTYMNLDLIDDHSVTSDDIDALGNRLFNSARLRFRQSGPVTGVSSLAPGTYGFHCSLHEGMRGSLTVVDP